MHGITTAIVAFQLLCIAIPSMIRRRSRFFITIGLTFAIIIVNALAEMIPSASFHVLTSALIGILQIGCLAVFVMSVGGMTIGELSEELASAYDALRGEEPGKEIVIPITGQMQKKRPVVYKDVAALDDEDDDDSPKVHTINDADHEGSTGVPPPPADRTAPIPLD